MVLADRRVTLLDGTGNVAKFPISGGFVEDVAFEPKLGLIYVCGFDNKKGTPPGQRRYPVQVAFVRALDRQGKQVWAAYGWDGQQVADMQLMADTRAYRLAVGGDGKLYVGGESAGGNTIWMRSSLKLEEKAALPKGDAYQQAYNTSANHITAIVRLDPKTGQSEMATLLLARLAVKGNKGNTLRMRALAADAQGNVYAGGPSAFCAQERRQLRPQRRRCLPGDFQPQLPADLRHHARGRRGHQRHRRRARHAGRRRGVQAGVGHASTAQGRRRRPRRRLRDLVCPAGQISE